ncbi:MAG: hypothetical protein AAF667_00135 [Pseudomonadota bacterium]
MALTNIVKRFSQDEDGAVTVDWVVLTSAVVGLGIAVMLSVGNSTTSLADDISTTILDSAIPTY